MPSAISVPTQHKTFLANGVIWAFWADTDIKYNTSLDGQNWGTITSIFSSPYGTGVLTGDEFSVWFDGTYANFAHGYSTSGGYTVAFRRAFPNVDSSIGWIGSDQVITTAPSIPRYLSVASDTNNYPWVAYQTNSSSSVQIYRSSRNDGSWATQSGFPVTVYSAASVSLIPLKNQNVASIFAITNGANWNVGAFTWFNGSSSFTSLITGTDLLAHPYVSAVANNDLVNVSIVYQNASSNLTSINYNSLSNAFGTPVVFYSSPIATTIYPSASITTESGYIYSFWINNTSGLVGYWPFDEGSGNYAYDLSGNSNTGTLVNGPSWISGKFGDALQFNAANSQYCFFNTVGLPSGSSARSIFAWVYVTSLPGSNDAFVVAWGDSSTQGDASALAIDPNGYLNWDYFGGRATSNLAVSVGTWHFIGLTYPGSGTTVTFYLDGSSATANLPTAPNTTLTKGYIAQWVGGGLYFNGIIDDVRIYNRVLSASEIKQISMIPLSKNILYAYYSTTTNSWTSTFIFGPIQASGFTSLDSLSLYYKDYGHYFGILSESNTPISGTLNFGVLLVTPDSSLKTFYDIGYNPQQTAKIYVVNNLLAIFNATTTSQIFSDVTQVAGVPIDVSTSNTIQPLIRFRNEDCGDVLKELQAASGWGIRINTDGSVRYAPDPASSPQSLKTFTRGVNLLDVERTLDTTSVINKIILSGSGAGTSQLSFVAQDFVSQAQFGVREKLILMTSAYDPTLLQSYAQQLLADYKQPREVLNVKVIDDSVGVVYNVGDYVSVNDPLLGINDQYRVLEIDKTFSSQGEETSLELGKIQFVSNAYSYKMPSLREVFGDVRTLAENASSYPQSIPQTETVSAQGVVSSGSPLTFTFTIDSSTILSVNNQLNLILSQLYLSSTSTATISSSTVQLITPSGQTITFSSVPIPSAQAPQPQTQTLNVLPNTTQYGTYAVKIISNSNASAPVSATYFVRFGSTMFAV